MSVDEIKALQRRLIGMDTNVVESGKFDAPTRAAIDHFTNDRTTLSWTHGQLTQPVREEIRKQLSPKN